jgi:serine protease Do
MVVKSSRFAYVSVALVAAVAFLVGTIFAGGITRSLVNAGRGDRDARRGAAHSNLPAGPLVNFADVVARVNPAVVNVDATSKSRGRRGHARPNNNDDDDGPDSFDAPFDSVQPKRDSDPARRGEGTGFIIDADGSILTNHHVIDRAERITVKLADGRSLKARVIGSDPDTDIALIKIDGQAGLPVAPLGDSSTLRAGEWVVAIGNPLGYEHSVTVGVVSYLGRKLFDASLDNYIQTDAAINFGNSGGPLINGRGEVIGINAAISSRASNIGFAVPINGATAILPQLRARGRVSRGYIGVGLRDIDPDLEQSLHLTVPHGALVQDVSDDSPGARAGLKPYDTIVAIDDHDIRNDDELIRDIAAKAPGTAAKLRVVRDGRQETVTVKLAERPARETDEPHKSDSAAPAEHRKDDDPLGISVKDLDTPTANRLEIPKAFRGVLVTKVEPLGPSFDAGIERNTLIMEVNRRPVDSASEYRKIARASHPGDVLALYLYYPDLDQRRLVTVRVDR